MGIRIPCLVDKAWSENKGYIKPPIPPEDITLCRFDMGQPEDTMKVASRIVSAMQHTSAAVFEQVSVLMLQDIMAGVTAENGYPESEVADARWILEKVAWFTASDSRPG